MNYDAVFHVDLDEEKVLKIAFSNILNYLTALEAMNRLDAKLVLLANGPAVTFFQKSKDFAELSSILAKDVRVCTCQNALNKFEITADMLAEGVEIIPAGIVELVELQRAGFAYIKP